MKRIQSGTRQVNQYDKILRENLEAALPGLIRNLLGIRAVHTEELPDDIQHTKERKPDVLKKVTDKSGETFVLHVEFQIKDEPEMVFRMADYFIMLARRYKLPVHQYVIYIGNGTPTMPLHFVSRQMSFKYELILLSEIDYHVLLQLQSPEENMLAILADLGKDNTKKAIEDIARQVVAKSTGDFIKKRRIQQLRIFAQLRKLAPENLLIMDSLAGIFSVENDIFYQLGEKRGIQKGIEKKRLEVAKSIVRNLLLTTDFSVSRIAALAEISEYRVRKIKKTLN